ncbi:XisI protein [Spirulina sp. CS-785/01]|uniref:XisI protein n=1 Tax=Spirulina sp. CS-785/01 TaxID=3021716 RepID=UPI00232DCBD6|nr:XisI protein [Spirulina sp. CS-785/01]MDB9312714.1 XisI protein [Spirulina sp. CS-785/01]
MDRLNEYRKFIYQILSYYASIPYRYGDTRTYVVVDKEENHFLLMHEGWEGKKRIHATLVHVEIYNGKIWIHHDGIEEGITDELVAKGVPKEHIVLAFHPPYMRPHTGYAVT